MYAWAYRHTGSYTHDHQTESKASSAVLFFKCIYHRASNSKSTAHWAWCRGLYSHNIAIIYIDAYNLLRVVLKLTIEPLQKAIVNILWYESMYDYREPWRQIQLLGSRTKLEHSPWLSVSDHQNSFWIMTDYDQDM